MDLELKATQIVYKMLEKGWKLVPDDYDYWGGHRLKSPWGTRTIEVWEDQIDFTSWLKTKSVRGDFKELYQILEDALEKKYNIGKQRDAIAEVNEVAKWLEESWL